MTTATISNIGTTSDFRTIEVSISDDGRYIAYTDNLGGLIPARPQHVIKIVDTQTGITRSLGNEIDIGTNDLQMTDPELSGDGQSIVFTYGDRYGSQSIIVQYDLRAGQLREVSTTVDGSAPNHPSSSASVSRDGRYVAFESDASNLVAGDTNDARDVFVKDMLTGTVRRVSVDSAGNEMLTRSIAPVISADGGTVLFDQTRSPIDYNPAGAFVKKLASGTLTGISADAGGPLIAAAHAADLSADGRYALFVAPSAQPSPDGEYFSRDVYRKDTQSGETILVSGNAGAAYSATAGNLSSDGRYVAFNSLTATVIPNRAGTTPTAELYMRDMLTGDISALTVDSGAGWGIGKFVFSGDGVHAAYFATTQNTAAAIKDMVPQTLWSATLLPGANIPPASGTWLPQQGNQTIEGGAGLDSAIYRGKLAEYKVSLSAGTVLVTDQQEARDGTDQLRGVERIRFSDGALAFDTAGNAGQAYRLYQAAFNRTADKGGLGYWIDRLDTGFTLKDIATGFMVSPEFKALYGAAPSNAQLVDQLYLNILHRPGEAGGVAYWNDVLDRKLINSADALAAFAESQENIAALVGVMDQGIAYTPLQ